MWPVIAALSQRERSRFPGLFRQSEQKMGSCAAAGRGGAAQLLEKASRGAVA
jgi:hypothetical protein